MSALFARRWLLLLAVLWGIAFTAIASTSVGALLDQAEAVRSSRPAQFDALLAQLAAQQDQATPAQLEQLQYLRAYRQVIGGNFDEGIRQAQALQASHDIDTRFRSGALIANAFAISGRFKDALRQLEDTLALLTQVKKPELREQGYIVAITTYNEIGQYPLALRYSRRLLADAVAPRTRCFAAQYNLQALQNTNALPTDDAPILAAIDQCMAIHEGLVASYIRTTLARKWAGEKEYARGITLLQEHLREAEATHFSRLIVEVHSLLGELHYAQGNFEEAEAHADAALAAAKNQSASLPLVAAYRIRYQVAEHRNDLTAALARYKAFAEAEKAYLGDIKSRELAYQIVREESQEKSQQISLLNRQNALLQLQQQVDQQSAQNARLYMLLFALLAATIGYWAYKTKRMQMSVKRMAEIDALTGICNRHHYTTQAEKTLARCKAVGEPVSLLMFDLDYFKSINDNYGHVTGDWVLKRVAEVCAELCRGIDHLGRIGGEEFAILLHGYDLKAATRMAEDCRVRLSRIDPLPSGYTFPISASFGVSSSTTSGYDLDKLLSHADQMLYRAKREGRNRVRAYVPDTSAELTGVNFGKDRSQPAESEEASPQGSMRA